MFQNIDELKLPARERLERAARAVAAAQGYAYRGEILEAAARINPRADQFVRIAQAVMLVLKPAGEYDKARSTPPAASA